MSLETYEADGVRADKFGRVVCVSVYREASISGHWESTVLCTLPEGFRPRTLIAAGVGLQESGNNDVVITIGKGGTVSVQGKGTAWRSGWLFCTTSFIAAT